MLCVCLPPPAYPEAAASPTERAAAGASGGARAARTESLTTDLRSRLEAEGEAIRFSELKSIVQTVAKEEKMIDG